MNSLKGKRSHNFGEGGTYCRFEINNRMTGRMSKPEIAVANGKTCAENPEFPPYPWLKGHGSIEGPRVLPHGQGVVVVSMAEGSWLH